MSYSNGSGGTLTIPSPTHVHHVDVGSAVRSLRRSLSRSPSKFRLRTTVSPAPVVETSGTSGPATPGAGIGNFSFGQESTTPPSPDRPAPVAQVPAVPSPFGISPCDIPAFLTPQPSHTTSTPFKPSIKLSLRSARSRPAASRPPPRTRVSPKSPLKRVFGPSIDSGNSIPPASEPEAQGQENPSFTEFALALSPVSRRNLEKPSRHSMHLDVSGSSKNGISKFLGNNTDSFTSISVSPMKRSDAMSVDESNMGSPVAKRRSLHGGSSLGLGSGFNILDLQPALQQGSGSQQGFDIHDDANHEYQLTGSLGMPFRETRDVMSPPTPTATANMPKRSSSLRKSTLQQRHGDTRTSLGRRAGEKQLAQFSAGVAATPPHGERPRLSLDQYLPLEEYTSLFSPKAPLQNPSVHPMPRAVNQPHPLSRTLTQSSSSSSVPDDSPTHAPIQLGERPRVPLNFSKSLPPGSTRPVNGPKPIETPDYKRVKPLQSAFMSTGLVSKMTRNPDLGLPDAPNSKITAMPDTPCKKQYPANTYPPQNSGGRRPSRPSFGSPSSPFRSSAIGPGRGNIFGLRDRPSASSFFQTSRPGHARKLSLLSLDGDDHNEPAGSQDDIPPTPTKSFLRTLGNTPSPAVQTPSISRSYLFGQAPFGIGTEEAAPSPSCKFTTVLPMVSTPVGQIKNESFSAIIGRPSTPTPAVAPRVSSALRRNVQAQRQANCFQYKVANAVSLASPLNRTGTPVSTTPQTPQYSLAPLDASHLSISQDDRERRCRTPATPTPQPHKFFAGPGDRRSSVTPHKNNAPLEVDESLIRMFDKAEPIGSGEFSQVYRVVKSSVPASLTALFAATPTKRSPLAPRADKVFAVKKIRFPSFGHKARQSKFREVNVLQSLVNSDKVIQYIHHWEANGHLYIQTEYCEEGSLDKFLAVVGKTGKLDEFRVWKILQETLQVGSIAFLRVPLGYLLTSTFRGWPLFMLLGSFILI